MKEKILSSIKKLWVLMQNKPRKSALISTLIITIPLAVFLTISLPDKSLINLIFVQLLIVFLIGCLIWYGLANIFGEKQDQELIDREMKSELQNIMNQSLIENGSITKQEEMVKL